MQSVRTTKIMSLSLKPELFDRISDYCSERGCSRTWFMQKAAERYLNEYLEDKEDYEIAAAAWKKFEKSGEKGIPLEEARKRLGV